jgi:uncharacterized membrane protein
MAGSAGFVDSGGESSGGAAAGDGPGPTPDCSCATSAALRVIDCGGGRHFSGHGNTYVAFDGSALIYAPDDGTGQYGLYLGTWSLARGTVLTDGWPLGLSDDGTVMLFGIGSDYYYADGSGSTPLTAELRVLSRDGKLAAGVRSAGSGLLEAVAWTRTDGIAGTGVTASDVGVLAISRDGSVIGGRVADDSHASTDATRPFLWSEATGPILIGDPPTDASVPQGVVAAVSASGESSAGVLLTSAGNYRVFRRSGTGELTDLGPCYSSPFFSCAAVPSPMGLSFSDDGAVLAGAIGAVGDPSAGNAFVYTDAGGMTLLAPDEPTTVRDISGDGSVVLGVFLDGLYDTGTPFVWDRTRGVRSLSDVLSTAGVSLDGWSLDDASELSKDGRVVVGVGACGGVPAIYRAVLPQ